ncbi:RusA family crossover junction endodeoxyribonuclease [Clostridium rectalis]|uniref:RusA family crossover junction endodeoxyribonuclease n=1 Tax=Clostridium rectalis TaxID=2040295 RepID=UPI000F633246|nr:RusA family crossover junction endodeoxyribonuclease [Clostridium rectalis]
MICKDFISVNHYMSYRSVKKGKFNMVMAYKPKTTKDFEKSFGEYVKQEIKKQGWIKPPKDKFINLDTVFYFPRVDMDAQNFFKSLSDILTSSGVWEDDNIVLEKVHRIYYDSENPRIELNVTVSDHIGIFDNQEDYKNFINTYCNNCKKGNKIGQKGGCSIYKKILESRIIDDIEINFNTGEKKCLKFKQK